MAPGKKNKTSDVSLMQQTKQQLLKVNVTNNHSHENKGISVDSTPKTEGLLDHNIEGINPHTQLQIQSPQTKIILTENIIANERENTVQLGHHTSNNSITIQAIVHRDPFSSQSQEDLSSPQSGHTQSPLSITPDRELLMAISPPYSGNSQMTDVAGPTMNVHNCSCSTTYPIYLLSGRLYTPS